RSTPPAGQHIALALPDLAARDALRARPTAQGLETTPRRAIGPIQNVLFFDPHGVLPEATWLRPTEEASSSLAATDRPRHRTTPRGPRRRARGRAPGGGGNEYALAPP